MINTKFDLINENNDFIFAKDITKNTYLILYPLKDNADKKRVKYDQVEYFPLIEINGKHYESIFFEEQINLFLAEKLFEIISNSGHDLRKNLLQIGEIFNNLYQNLDKRFIRGMFAELKAIKEFSLVPFSAENSVYDFRDSNENDIEVKSFSPVSRDIIISYQQIANNLNARIIFLEVIESSEGESIRDLFKNLDSIFIDRYKSINFLDERTLQYKFKIGQTIETTSNILSQGLNMPHKSKNANFVFNVDEFNEK